MSCGGIAEDANDLAFGKDVAVVQRKKQGLADGECGLSGGIWSGGHLVSTFKGFAATLAYRRRKVGRRTNLDQLRKGSSAEDRGMSA